MKMTKFERLLHEKRDDAAQRPLYENGVRYEDEPKTLRDILEAKPKAKAEPVNDKQIDRDDGYER